MEKGWLDRRVTGAVEGGTRRNWNRGVWSAAELEKRRVERGRSGAEEGWSAVDQNRRGGTVAAPRRNDTRRVAVGRQLRAYAMRCDATAETSGDDAKAVGRQLDQIRRRRYAVVTGANKGIGLEVARQLASTGVKVVLTSRDEKRGLHALETLKDLSDFVLFHQLDVADHASVASLADFTNCLL
ncbi:hypothetical protein Ahy_A09g041668 [Arachis hypogaea]|uniref:(+)-neomenthol dehydrogenase n=1 Tax=Arachis hypogaea TaxID=3818 RepID=A0A445BDG2_ARAHY|nr:hypothetical protein Ahy_A09g041668 [Arachis hypogaea]